MNFSELQEWTRKMNQLMFDNPQPGLITWNLMVAEHIEKLIGKDPQQIERAVDILENTCEDEDVPLWVVSRIGRAIDILE